MGNKLFIHGYDAVGYGALNAGCRHFFGYPITPQNEITEFFARELPKRGGRFVQTESESSSASMVFGAAAAGVRVMTSTSSPGWGLMQETISHISMCELPCVIVDVQRGGPGQGTTRHAQTDYLNATRGGHGGYKNIVLAPSSVQECHDLMQLAFYLADKHRILTVVLADGILIQIAEYINADPIEYDGLPPKDWALTGFGKKDGRFDQIHSTRGLIPPIYKTVVEQLHEKYNRISETEVRFKTYEADDADLLLIAYGYVARCAEEAVNMARSEGLKVGLIQPVTLWPFPYAVLNEKASKGSRFLVVEDSMGQLLEDVKLGVEGKSRIDFLGMSARHVDGELGMIFPETIFKEVKRLT
ncbi:MAG: 3-methyl-2-oxobutanoate dehydrogenase subunit VorB [Desulfatiglans sp.]|jgi:2-oxoglutarate ferredoxin oxidoreductase subunit alpha|nr:3-methyl-2-oxobutanoate dehydrogenase subunit VorB [Thermodesulfobacteriota bacterium]MEE4352182.1 3-methyl-2-oxobutanoate dehydrogenase subunit VorB [Desulfatiglans sp.]